ncbi:MAG: hypothetical protein KJ584_05145 [Candidatus Omnitrophica bacterium]|nr:hypothetical protein [Candidatus Omnitrophota bacterium]
MADADEKLIEKIRGSDLFIVLGTRNYVTSLKEGKDNIAIQIDIARKFKKPFFMVIDRNLSKEDRQYLDEYLSKDNIISRMEVDMGNISSTTYIAKEIKTLVRELRTTADDKGVTIATPYDDDDE